MHKLLSLPLIAILSASAFAGQFIAPSAKNTSATWSEQSSADFAALDYIKIKSAGHSRMDALFINMELVLPDDDPYFFVAILRDSPALANLAGRSSPLRLPLTGDDAEDGTDQWIYLESVTGVIPEGPAMLALSTGPMALTPDVEPTGVEFIRYSEVDLRNRAVKVVRRGIPARTAVGRDVETSLEVMARLPRKAWDAGTIATVVHMWEPVAEGVFEVIDPAPGTTRVVSFNVLDPASFIPANNESYWLDAEAVGAGQSCHVLVYIADDQGFSNIGGVPWLPLVGPASAIPLEADLPDSATGMDIRTILTYRVNRNPR